MANNQIMGYFYFDESIHERAGFILGAYVYSLRDLTPLVFEQLMAVGLRPGEDEFKSSTKMEGNLNQQELRGKLMELFWNVKLGLVVVPTEQRKNLGSEALRGLRKITEANDLMDQNHVVYFDQGIAFRDRAALADELGLSKYCAIHMDQDSRLVGGLQLADLAAHTMSVMLLEKLGIINKLVRAGENSGYDPDLNIELGFVMWATIRYHFFTMDNIDLSLDQLEGFTLDTRSYALYVAESCDERLRKAVEDRFGECYMGCIH